MRKSDFSFVRALPRPCALRAPTVISVRIENIRTEITVIGKSNQGVGSDTRSSIAGG
jgi:hypothetical protein